MNRIERSRRVRAIRASLGGSLLCLALLVPVGVRAAALSTGQVYYVATQGSDDNPGTLAAPWRTLQHAADVAVAGDTVYARGGVYNETVTVSHSGSAEAGPITFASYPGESAVLSGQGLSVPADMHGLWNLRDRSYVTIKGFDVGNYRASSTGQTPVGIYISGAGSHVSLLDNHIHDIVNTVERCPDGNAFGIEVYGDRMPQSISDLTISGNEVDHLRTGCSESLSLTGNVEQWAITDNVVHNNDNIGIAALGFEGLVSDAMYDQARHGRIAANVVYNISSEGNGAYASGDFSSDGIYVEGGTDVVVERNLVEYVDIGIELACETADRFTSDVIARDNLVMFSQSAGISIGGASRGNGGTQRATIVNNTLFQNDRAGTGSGEFQIQYHVSDTVFENNLISATEDGLLVNFWPTATQDAGYTSPGLLDHNLFYAAGGSGNANWVWLGKSYLGLAAYRKASGGDAASILADPQFLDETAPDLHVTPLSPVRGAGALLSASQTGGLDYDGNPRVTGGQIDIGAYQQP